MTERWTTEAARRRLEEEIDAKKEAARQTRAGQRAQQRAAGIKERGTPLGPPFQD